MNYRLFAMVLLSMLWAFPLGAEDDESDFHGACILTAEGYLEQGTCHLVSTGEGFRVRVQPPQKLAFLPERRPPTWERQKGQVTKGMWRHSDLGPVMLVRLGASEDHVQTTLTLIPMTGAVKQFFDESHGQQETRETYYWLEPAEPGVYELVVE